MDPDMVRMHSPAICTLPWQVHTRWYMGRCGYEMFCAVESSRPEYKWAMYTAHESSDGRAITRACGLADGLAACDHSSMEKRARETAFPFMLVLKVRAAVSMSL